MNASEPNTPPERVVAAWQLRRGDWVQRDDIVQQIMSIKDDVDRSIWIFTNREGWLRLRRNAPVGIWYRDPRPAPVGDPAAPF